MTSPRLFVPELTSEQLDALQRRLQNINWPHTVGTDDWMYGVPAAWLKNMADYWRDEWQWSRAQSAMQAWPHYQIEIDGIPIHYLYAEASRPDAPALILTHGWPWTFWDWKDAVLRLVAERIKLSMWSYRRCLASASPHLCAKLGSTWLESPDFG